MIYYNLWDSINHAETSVIFASSQHIPTVLKLAAHSPVVKVIISIDDLNSDSKKILGAWGQERNIKLYEFSESVYMFHKMTQILLSK